MSEDARKQKQTKALEKAKEAAYNKDFPSFLGHLDESKFLDGAAVRLGEKYNWSFDKERVYEILTTATDKFYEAASTGKKILSSGSYLWKIIDNLAVDVFRELKKHKSIDEMDLDRNVSMVSNPVEGVLDIKDDDTAEYEELKKKGIEIARSLLPRIGSDNVQKVLEYIIDAVEKGVEDVTNQEISEALGLSEASVGKWKQRGFERLKRASIEAGYREDLISVEGFEGDENVD